MRELDIATAPRRNSKLWEAGTTTWEELTAWGEDPGTTKESGNYLLGRLSGRTRSNSTIVSRSAVTLDADAAQADLLDRLRERLPGVAWWAHTTYNSAPDALRYRLVVPLDRDVDPEEYEAVTLTLIRELGMEQFDLGSIQPARYMFRPAARQRDWFTSVVAPGAELEVGPVLGRFDPDLSDLPTPPTASRSKRDPFTLEGIAGTFNRVYADDWEGLIARYELPYEEAGERRWHLMGARSQAGVSEVRPGLIYSHHAGDPAGGRARSAFDLVRVHRFGELDADSSPTTPINRLPSHMAMAELAAIDPGVIREAVGADFADDAQASDGWRLGLTVSSRTGHIKDHIDNWDLIRANDPAFTGLVYNELTLSVETDADLPWRRVEEGGPVFGHVDRAALCFYIEREYGIRPTRALVDGLVDTTAGSRRVNPIREYLEGLEWDGRPRLETCLPGVTPTPYTRMVARKVMVAAAARILEPGCKWDHTLVLYGPEGLGKSWWIDRVARGYSASLGPIGSKDTLLAMQRSWVMISDEGHSLRKADAEAQKEFLTRTVDVFRMPYDREPAAHPRHCVIWGTTNDEVFLRRQEGNRRFLIVRCEERVDFDRLTDDYVDQLWAEAMAYYTAGERLYLDDLQADQAAEEREAFTEEDPLEGLISEYLDTPKPEDWAELSPDGRRSWMANRTEGLVPEGTLRQDIVSNLQVWVEVLGGNLDDNRRRGDLLNIGSSIRRIPGWRIRPGRTRIHGYGPQQVWERVTGSGSSGTEAGPEE